MYISDFCKTKPCLNGATCASYLWGRTCTCVSGYSGDDYKQVRHLLPLLQTSDGPEDMLKLLNHEIEVKLSLTLVLRSILGHIGPYYKRIMIVHHVILVI